MNIRLKELNLRNFKGIKDMKLNLNGKNLCLYGPNEAGKSTTDDAIKWLFFDKDRFDRSNFSIKTLDKDNNVIHGLEHEVEGILLIDDKEMKLKKIYKENWTQKRGTANKLLTGHTTNHYIDDVPCSKGEYVKKISEIIDENIFKLVTNPNYFNNVLKWEERRKMIFELVGDLEDKEVINSSEKLKRLGELLEDRNIEDFKKIIAEKKKKINKKLEEIPSRIDEQRRSIKDIDEINVDSIEFRIKGIKGSITEIDNQILDHSNIYKKNSEIKTEVYKLKDELRDIKYQAVKNAEKPKQELERAIEDLEINIKTLERKINNSQHEVSMLAKDNNEVIKYIEDCEKVMTELSTKWYDIKNSKFESTGVIDSCPTCNQQLPQGEIDQQIEEMRMNFEEDKRKKLSGINSKGKSKKDEKEKLEERKLLNENKILEAEKEIENTNSKIEAIKEEIKTKKALLEGFEVSEFVPTDRYMEIERKITTLEELIVEPDETVINELKAKKTELEGKVDDLKYQIRAKEYNEQANQRIEELLEEEKQLSITKADLEGQEFLCDEFVRTKVNLLESDINSKFKVVKFKMFEIQVNGGLKECCESLIDGVPYSDANNAAQINGGIDIINTLCKHYNVSAPIFIDNAESINDIENCDSQLINMYVIDNERLEELSKRPEYQKIKGAKGKHLLIKYESEVI